MDKFKALTKIASEIEKCKICKQNKSGIAVPGEGNPDAKIVFVGEAPGKNEAKTGRPFIGRSGKLLRSFIEEIGLKERDVFITSPVKYLPDSGTPTPTDIAHGRIHLLKQLNIIKPKIIVLLGSVAALALLEEKIAVFKRHGEVVEKNGVKYFIMLHPSFILRFSKYKEAYKKDFLSLKNYADLKRE